MCVCPSCTVPDTREPASRASERRRRPPALSCGSSPSSSCAAAARVSVVDCVLCLSCLIVSLSRCLLCLFPFPFPRVRLCLSCDRKRGAGETHLAKDRRVSFFTNPRSSISCCCCCYCCCSLCHCIGCCDFLCTACLSFSLSLSNAPSVCLRVCGPVWVSGQALVRVWHRRTLCLSPAIAMVRVSEGVSECHGVQG